MNTPPTRAKTRVKPTLVSAPRKQKRKRSAGSSSGPDTPPNTNPNKRRRSNRIKEQKLKSTTNTTKQFVPMQNIQTIPDLIENARNWRKWHDSQQTDKLTFDEIEYTKILDIIPFLEELESMIGMDDLKKAIVQQLKFFVQGMFQNTMMNLILTGSPGTGKTTVGKLLANIYYHIGVLREAEDVEIKEDDESEDDEEEYSDESSEEESPAPLRGAHNEPFKVANRSDLIAGYLGQTAIKTKKFLKSCLGSVVFIDEAYSLGSDNDSFSTECIDELNRFLSEHAGQIICILAGYEKDLNERFFSKNEGLRRRFNWKFHMPKYTADQLRDIFIYCMKKEEWEFQPDAIDVKLFQTNKELFTENGGDCEELFNLVKIKHSDRIFGLIETEKKKQRFTINDKDFQRGFKHFIKKKKILIGINNSTFHHMYL